MESFGDYLRAKRKEAKVSATELSYRLGRNQTYISQLESGAVQPPDDEHLAEIAAALNCEPDEMRSFR